MKFRLFLFLVSVTIGSSLIQAQNIVWIKSLHPKLDTINLNPPVKEYFQVLSSDSLTKHGYYFQFSYDGDTIQKYQYQYNEKHGICVDYYEGNRPKYVVRYNNGFKEGIAQYYNLYKKVIFTEKYSKIRDGYYLYQQLDYRGIPASKGYVNKFGFDSLFQEFYPNKQIKTSYVFKDNKRTGPFTIYNQDGKKIQQGFYKDGELDSTIINYDLKKGVMIAQANYSLGKLDGKLTEYYLDGKVAKVAHYKENLSHGLTSTFYANGNKKSEENYHYGLLSGFLKTYYSNGKLKTSAFIINGSKDGVYKEFSETGQLILEVEMNNGFPHGKSLAWYGNGIPKYKFNYQKGYKVGDNYTYHSNGEIKLLEKVNKEQTELETKLYNESKTLLEHKHYLISKSQEGYKQILNGELTIFYPNKEKKLEETYVKGKLNGLKVTYDSIGNKSSEELFNFGIKNGVEKYYYNSGAIKSEVNYKNSKKYGKAIYYFDNGKIQEEGNWLNDKKNGVWKYYDETGKKINGENWKYGNLVVPTLKKQKSSPVKK